MPIYVLRDGEAPKPAGWAAYLRAAAMILLIVALAAVVIFVGLAVALIAVAVSAVAALVYAVRRRLAGGSKPRSAPVEPQTAASTQPAGGEARVIEVDEIIVRR
ncbi:MAG TPA: hypothetical protein DIT13_04335 [Verrucomicrobiales bacterium]|nr:hypothetical protein [Verrucomicrobiales bacterium]HRJ08200.1 hypothetical protein [Prosthecobacter sp.]HRK16123.1 hypothetical protein [Prosthecobacter sp.]